MFQKRITANAMFRLTLLVLFFGFANVSWAQTTAGVFGPGVKQGDRSFQWRAAVDDNDDFDSVWSSRIHYQYALDDAWRVRAVLSGDTVELNEFEPVFLQTELQWHYKKPTQSSKWSSALRADLRIVENDDGAHQVGLNWTNQYPLNDKFTVTTVLLSALQFGSKRSSGLRLESRTAIDYQLKNNLKLGLHSFNAFGNLKNLNGFDKQNHRIGPTLSGRIGEKTNFLLGPLLGISDAAPDVEFRFWVGRSL